MIPDIPVARRKCDRTLPGAPCPSYDDGTWPEGCDCYMRLNDDRGDNSLALTLLTLLLAAIALVVMVYTVMAADNIPKEQCLTREQAKAAYPGQWLYWKTEQRCWYGRSDYAKPVRKSKGAKATQQVFDANGNAVQRKIKADDVDAVQYGEEAERRLRTCCWPPMPAPAFLPWEERIGK